MLIGERITKFGDFARLHYFFDTWGPPLVVLLDMGFWNRVTISPNDMVILIRISLSIVRDFHDYISTIL